MSKYAVMIVPFEEDGSEYVRNGCGAMWTNDTPLKLFDTREEAHEGLQKRDTENEGDV